MPPALADTMDPEWAAALQPVAPQIAAMGDFLRAEVAAGRTYLPAGANVLRAFQAPDVGCQGADRRSGPLPDARARDRAVVSPSTDRSDPSRGHWPTSTGSSSRISGSCRRAHGDLTKWTESGVLLLNRVLTVAPGASAVAQGQGLGEGDRAGDHRTGGARRTARGHPVGQGCPDPDSDARRFPHIASTHPSPMSADRGFFGSKPFSRANALLVEQGAEPVDWTWNDRTGDGRAMPRPLTRTCANRDALGYLPGAHHRHPTARPRPAPGRPDPDGHR